jgi:hypothetical protein
MGSTAATAHVTDDQIEFASETGQKTYPIREMPDALFLWQVESRHAILEALGKGRKPTDFHAHLPVVATFNPTRAFPVHTTTKATGLIPRDEHLDEYITAASTCLDEAKQMPWDESLAARLSVTEQLYRHPEHIDRRKFGLVEIFQGQTYRDLAANPVMAMQYTGPWPEYHSYQLNGVIEQIGPGDRRFEFLHLMRMLFEHNSFHVQQPDYPSGYLFWISEVFDKSPRHKPAGRRIT